MIQTVFNEGLKNEPDNRSAFQLFLVVLVEDVFVLVPVLMYVIVFFQILDFVFQRDHGHCVLERVFENIRQGLDDSV